MSASGALPGLAWIIIVGGVLTGLLAMPRLRSAFTERSERVETWLYGEAPVAREEDQVEISAPQERAEIESLDWSLYDEE